MQHNLPIKLSHSTLSMIKVYKEGKDSLTQRQKAEFESEIWESITPRQRKVLRVHFDSHSVRREALPVLLGGTKYEYTHRYGILNLGKAGQKIWKLLDQGLITLNLASSLAVQARRQVQNDPLDKTLGECIDELCSEQEREKVRASPKSRKKKTKKSSSLPKKKPPTNRARAARNLYSRVEELYAEHFADTLSQLHEAERDALMREVRVGIKLTAESLHRRAQHFKDAMDLSKFNDDNERRKLVRAYSELSLKPPKKNEPIDLKSVKRRYRSLALEHHPDRNLDQPEHIQKATTRQFRKYVKAHDFICEYERRRRCA